jgi:hypothetical protein
VTRWRGLGNTQRQAQELMSGPGLSTKAKLLSFNRTQSRAVSGLLTGHNTLRRHLHLLGLEDSPLCRKCGVEEETSAHILCEYEALASLRYTHLGSFLEPEDIKSLNLGAIWSFSKATWGTKGLSARPRCIGASLVLYPSSINQYVTRITGTLCEDRGPRWHSG